MICEKFLNYILFEKLDVKSVMRFLKNCGLNLYKLVSQGSDGCVTMAGHISGVQKIIINYYPMELSFHCASPILNLVFNDFIEVREVKIIAGILK